MQMVDFTANEQKYVDFAENKPELYLGTHTRKFQIQDPIITLALILCKDYAAEIHSHSPTSKKCHNNNNIMNVVFS